MWGYGLDRTGSGQGQVAGTCECGGPTEPKDDEPRLRYYIPTIRTYVPALSAYVTPATTFQHPPTHSLLSYILCKACWWDLNIR